MTGDLVSFDLRADLAEVRRVLAGYEGGAEKVVARTINRVLPSVRTAAARDIARNMRLPVGRVRDSIKIGRRAYVRSLSADIRASGKRIPLIAFRARPTLAGVTYDLGQGRKLFPRAFIRTRTDTQQRAVLRRVSAGGDKLVPDYPIREHYGPSIPRVFLSDALVQAMRTTARARWEREIQAQLRFFLIEKGAING